MATCNLSQLGGPIFVCTFLHGAFARRGLQLNMSPGKTSAVVTLRGRGAVEQRQTYLLCSNPGLDFTIADGQTLRLALLAKYKHLGVQVASNHSMDLELEARICSAKSAFAVLARPLLTNRHFPLQVRLRLFQSLILTRLLFGAGAWPVLTVRQLDRMQKVLLSFLRRVLRLRIDGDHHVSNDELFVKTGTAPLRAMLAKERLLFAQQLFAYSADFVQHLAHLEYTATSASWLAGVKADLRWAAEVDPTIPPHWAADLTDAIDHWQQPTRPSWKSKVRRLWKRHLQQEELMIHAHGFHKLIFRTLTQGGCEFEPRLDSLNQLGTTPTASYPCDCGRTFSTAQGLASHRRLAHGVRALEAPFLQGHTCPICLRFLWTTNRLRGHLSDMPRDGSPNPCYAQLCRLGYVTEYEATDFPIAQRGVSRRDSLQAQGPMLDPTPAAFKELAHLQIQIDTLCTTLSDVLSARAIEDGEHLGAALTQVTQCWFAAFVRNGRSIQDIRDLGDSWMELLMCYEEDAPPDVTWESMVFCIGAGTGSPSLWTPLQMDGWRTLSWRSTISSLRASLDFRLKPVLLP